MVTVEVDPARVESRLAAGEIGCPCCVDGTSRSVGVMPVLVGWWVWRIPCVLGERGAEVAPFTSRLSYRHPADRDQICSVAKETPTAPAELTEDPTPTLVAAPGCSHFRPRKSGVPCDIEPV